MLPQFQRIVTLSVMSILVGLFTWIYVRDRQPRARLWMIGWACILAHFTGMLLFSFGLIPARLADWSAYSTLVAAASAFFLSVCEARIALPDRIVFWAGIVAPAVAYWTCMVFGVQNPAVYRALLAIALAAGVWLTLRESQQPRGRLAVWLALAVVPGIWAAWRAAIDVQSGMDFLLFAGFAITGWRYWTYFRRLTPGILLASLSFLAWGLVFPVAEVCAALGIGIPGDHVVWDLPKYFVAFGMIMTLSENQTEILQVEISVRKRAEEAAQAATFKVRDRTLQLQQAEEKWKALFGPKDLDLPYWKSLSDPNYIPPSPSSLPPKKPPPPPKKNAPRKVKSHDVEAVRAEFDRNLSHRKVLEQQKELEKLKRVATQFAKLGSGKKSMFGGKLARK